LVEAAQITSGESSKIFGCQIPSLICSSLSRCLSASKAKSSASEDYSSFNIVVILTYQNYKLQLDKKIYSR